MKNASTHRTSMHAGQPAFLNLWIFLAAVLTQLISLRTFAEGIILPGIAEQRPAENPLQITITNVQISMAAGELTMTNLFGGLRLTTEKVMEATVTFDCINPNDSDLGLSSNAESRILSEMILSGKNGAKWRLNLIYDNQANPASCSFLPVRAAHGKSLVIKGNSTCQFTSHLYLESLPLVAAGRISTAQPDFGPDAGTWFFSYSSLHGDFLHDSRIFKLAGECPAAIKFRQINP